ncbi:hypothetical protein N7G274_006353 [Stereocaulon virgatum]|uniref:Uncharacterized protein n=1 Tax=Stereocaulon virgatum TaxID=373712 RepID=A0ABR4A501_9LECA
MLVPPRLSFQSSKSLYSPGAGGVIHFLKVRAEVLRLPTLHAPRGGITLFLPAAKSLAWPEHKSRALTIQAKISAGKNYLGWASKRATKPGRLARWLSRCLNRDQALVSTCRLPLPLPPETASASLVAGYACPP